MNIRPTASPSQSPDDDSFTSITRTSQPLAIFPVGLALFHEGTETLLRILEAIEFVEENVHGMFKAFAQGQAHAAKDGFFRHGEDGTGMSVNAAHEVAHSFFELGFGDEAMDHAEFEGALRRHRLAGENQFESDFRSDKKRQNGGGQRRKNADADFRLSKARFGSGDD